MDHSLSITAQIFFTGALVGLCWTVQLAVYPLFAPLIRTGGTAAFRSYHAAYTRAMGWIAAPLMLAELALAFAWLALKPGSLTALAGLGLVVAVWLLTFVLIVPIHSRLQTAPTETDALRLTRLNGFRTALWTARAALLAAVLLRA